MKKIAILLLLLFVPLMAMDEAKLAPDNKAWFEAHGILMQNKVPGIEEDWTEADVFLQLHPNMQRGYRSLFWDLRKEPGLDTVFYANLDYDGENYDFSIIVSYEGYKEYFAPSENGWRLIKSWAITWIKNYGPYK